MTGWGFSALAALTAALAAFVGLELGAGTADEVSMSAAPSPAAPQSTPAPATSIAHSIRRDSVQTILARPLFAPNRRPVAGAAAAAVGLPRVAGILVDGHSRSVIFAGAADGKPLVVGEGAMVAGFRVHAIENGQVTVVGPDGPRVLRPSFDPNPRPVSIVSPPAGLLPGFGAPPIPNAR